MLSFHQKHKALTICFVHYTKVLPINLISVLVPKLDWDIYTENFVRTNLLMMIELRNIYEFGVQSWWLEYATPYTHYTPNGKYTVLLNQICICCVYK